MLCDLMMVLSWKMSATEPDNRLLRVLVVKLNREFSARLPMFIADRVFVLPDDESESCKSTFNLRSLCSIL